ncbi:MAG: 2Fe-2S iron-sulfur cluster-binding protein [Polyangiaceae bacterium]
MPVRVRVEGKDRVLPAAPGDDLLEVFQSNGEPIATSCGGVASCGLCRVTVLAGGGALVPIKPQELVHLGNVAKVIGLRLACQAVIRPEEDAEILVRIPHVDSAEDVEDRKQRKADRARATRTHSPPPSSRPPPGSARQPPIEWRPGRGPEPQNGPEGKGGT